MPILRAIVLDSGPLGLLANAKSSPDSLACHQWVRTHLVAGVEIFIPEVTDYEVRRELLQARLIESVSALDALQNALDYLVLTTSVMRRAAKLWAAVRQAGQPTTDRHALDGDVILAAQTLALGYAPEEVVVATTNAGHLSRFVTAARWQNIS
jgi:predicted nucleic acid-binding protein